MLITVTNPDVLKQFPHLAPPRPVLVDTVVVERGKHRESRGLRSESTYAEDPGDARAGHGRLTVCSVCGTYLRAGQPHSALSPTPHQSLDMLTVVEPLPRLRASDPEPF